MFCKNCGNELPGGQAVVCMKCGCNPQTGKEYCANCGAHVNENQVVCVKCGSALKSAAAGNAGAAPRPGSTAGVKDRSTAGLLALLLGGFGVHQFYLGNTMSGILHLVLGCLCGVGCIISLIEGIRYLTMSDEEFYVTYVQNKRDWF